MRTARNRDLAQIVGTARNSAKLCAPLATSALITRPLLRARIEQAGKVVLLLAPPGSGKTALLTQWHAHFGTSHRTAWLLCERRDRDPVPFFSCLAASVDKALGCSIAGFDGASAHTQASAEHLADALGDELKALTHELVIVIDDLQCLDGAESERLLSTMILQSSPRVRWVLATRRAPGFDLQRFKLDAALTLLDAADLAFQPEQVCELARLLHATQPSLQNAIELCGQTEGWVAGLKLALLEGRAASNADGLNQEVVAVDAHEVGPTLQPMPVLTQRELDLLKLVSLGLSNRDISKRSNITLLTTKWHLKNVFAKLGVSTRMEAVFRAQELRLVDGQPPSLSLR